MSEAKSILSVELNQEALAKIAYVSTFAGTKDIRSYLNCVYLNNSRGLVAVATNGNYLSRAVIEEATVGDNFELLIPIDFVLNVLNKFKSKYATLKLQVWDNGDYKWLSAVDGQTGVIIASTTFGDLYEAKFPDWQRVMPNDKEEPVDRTVGINSAYLALLNKAYKAYRQHDNTLTERVILKVLGEGKPLVFDCAEVAITTLIMPMRI